VPAVHTKSLHTGGLCRLVLARRNFAFESGGERADKLWASDKRGWDPRPPTAARSMRLHTKPSGRSGAAGFVVSEADRPGRSALPRQTVSLSASARCRYRDSSVTSDNHPQPVLLPQLEHV
jgi:hypothetical protein